MSNYRVRQVLALRLPDRQNRFMVALATRMNDDSRSIRVAFSTLIDDAGQARNTAKAARRELESGGKLLVTGGGRGPGDKPLWTALCLPEKGVNIADPHTDEPKGVSDVDPLSPVDNSAKGVNGTELRGSTEPEKGGQPESPDLRKPDTGLNRGANSLGSSLSQPAGTADEGNDERENDPDDEDGEDELDPDVVLLASVVPGADLLDVEGAITTLQLRKHHGEIRTTVRAYLRKIIENGDARSIVEDAADQRRRDERALAKYGDPFGSPVSPDIAPGPHPWAPAPPFAGPVVAGEVVHDGASSRAETATEANAAATLLAAVDPDVTAVEAAEAVEILRQRGARQPVAVLQAEIDGGNGYKLLGEARHRIDRQGMAEWDVAERPAALTTVDADTPETRTSVTPAETSYRTGWLNLECPVCKAAPTRYCTNPATGAATATHRERFRAETAAS